MDRVLIRDLAKHINQEIVLKGWVHKKREQKKVSFLFLRDHTGLVQVVISHGKNKNIDEIFHEVTLESAIIIKGKAIKNAVSPTNEIEIQPTELTIAALAHPKLPIQIFDERIEPGIDVRLDWRYLDLRNDKRRLIFQIQTDLERAMREFFEMNDFIEIHSPKIMGAPSESGAELFEIKYFDGIAYLAQSPQFYKQMAMAAGFDKVFEIGPVFRANPSFTKRHDTEFTSIDIEISWIDSHHDLLAFEERWIQHFLKRLDEKWGDTIKEKFGVELEIPKIPFPRIKYLEAKEEIRNEGVPVSNNADIGTEAERALGKIIKEKYDHDFVFVIDYPYKFRPFYHMKHKSDPELTKSFDLIWKGMEVTTGAQREHRYDVLCNQGREKGLSLDFIQFYLDFFKYGCPPHGGYGFGLTRTLMNLLNISNVREVTYVYRGPKRITP
ncbi:MAG: aspartate--tRNA(Asn) ligase [Promethearchaeota archaeon]